MTDVVPRTTSSPVAPPPVDRPTIVPDAVTKGRARVLSIIVPPLVTLAFVVGLWYFVSYGLLKPSRRFLLPPPQQVIRTGFLTWSNFHQILEGLALTARAAAIGFGIATVIGMTLAVIMSQAKSFERAPTPTPSYSRPSRSWPSCR